MDVEHIRLYHSTDEKGFKGILSSGRLIGSEILNPPDGYSGDGNLTPDRRASELFMVSYRGPGQWKVSEGPPCLLTLCFNVPRRIVREVGSTHTFGCAEYVTICNVDGRDVPQVYFDNKHAGVYPLDRKQALNEEANGTRRFFELPTSYLEDFEEIKLGQIT